MTRSEPDKAHEEKVQKTADGERLVAHSVFTEGDAELREIQDTNEVNRVAAYQEAGYVASPGYGDYHKTRLAAKHGNAVLAGLGQGVADDPAAAVVDIVREGSKVDSQDAAQARKAAGKTRQDGPQGRATRSQVMMGDTGGVTRGGAEGVGKSASSTGTASDDLGMDASVGAAPANPDADGIENTPQDRPTEQPKPADSTKPASARGKARS